MFEGQGLRAYAHLVGVAAVMVAPSAFGIRRTAPRASLRSLVGVDASSNRQPDMYTPDITEYDSNNAWNQNFDDGNLNYNDKDNRNQVRAVRQ